MADGEPKISAAIETLAGQGYVPRTCLLPPDLAVPLVLYELGRGRSPCWGCNLDRKVCKGQPRRGGG